MKDYYYILGIDKTATTEQIKHAYRKLSLKFHPDKNDGDKFFEDRFKQIQEAYETLSNPDKRKTYDSSNSYSKFNHASDAEEQLKKEFEKELNKRKKEFEEEIIKKDKKHREEVENLKQRKNRKNSIRSKYWYTISAILIVGITFFFRYNLQHNEASPMFDSAAATTTSIASLVDTKPSIIDSKNGILYEADISNSFSYATFTDTQKLAIETFLNLRSNINSRYKFIPETFFDKSVLMLAREKWGFGKDFHPYYQQGDFNNDGYGDFAIALFETENDTNSKNVILVFNGTKNKTYEINYEEYLNLNNELFIYNNANNLYYGIMETDIGGVFIPTSHGYVVEKEIKTDSLKEIDDLEKISFGDFKIKEDYECAIESGELHIDEIVKGKFKFKLKVSNRSGYEGNIEGVAAFIDKNEAIFKDANHCNLTFQFQNSEIKIVENDCMNYHGAGICFNGTYDNKTKNDYGK